MAEKLCLQWNDFKDNAIDTFGSLREDKDFTDVTLVCEDGMKIDVHKVILANSSPFFDNVLRQNKHIHPLIYMRGVKSEDLFAIVDFLYCGEANVYQESLDSFLAIAGELQLKGLTEKVDKNKGAIKDETFKMAAPQKSKPVLKNIMKAVEPSQLNFGREVALTSHFISGDFQELEDKCISMMVKTSERNVHGQALYLCKMCGKNEISGTLKRHIESNHLEGVSIPCNSCGKSFRSRHSLAKHTRDNHKNYKDNIRHHSPSIF